MSDDQAHLLAAAANRLADGEEEEVSSGTSLAPEAAAADLKRWAGARVWLGCVFKLASSCFAESAPLAMRCSQLAGITVSEFGMPSPLWHAVSWPPPWPFSTLPCSRVSDLLASTLADERPSIATMLAQLRTLVDGCFASMMRFSSQHQRAQQAQRAAQQASGAGEAPEVTSTPAGAAGSAGDGQPLGLDGMRALLLQHVPMAVADLRRQHMEAEEAGERRQLSVRFFLELLLRLSICAYGEQRGARPCVAVDLQHEFCLVPVGLQHEVCLLEHVQACRCLSAHSHRSRSTAE